MLAVTRGANVEFQDSGRAGRLIRDAKYPVAGAGRLRRVSGVGEAWLGRRPDTAKVAGSNPAQPTRTVPRTFQDIAVHLLELQKDGRRPLTIVSHGGILRHLARNCNLIDPEAVKLPVYNHRYFIRLLPGHATWMMAFAAA